MGVTQGFGCHQEARGYKSKVLASHGLLSAKSSNEFNSITAVKV